MDHLKQEPWWESVSLTRPRCNLWKMTLWKMTFGRQPPEDDPESTPLRHNCEDGDGDDLQKTALQKMTSSDSPPSRDLVPLF